MKQSADNWFPSSGEITSVADAVDVAVRCCEKSDWKLLSKPRLLYKAPFGIWYRGELSETWDLLPSVFRPREDRFYDETSLFHHFSLRLPGYRTEHNSAFEWLCLMQHYGTPTRLLDWSESVLIGLYFCVNGSGFSRKDAALYVLNASALNDDSKLDDRPGRPRIYIPSSFNTVLRATMAGYRKVRHILFSNELDDVDRSDRPPEDLMKKLREMATAGRLADTDDTKCKFFLQQMIKPVAVFPYRTNSRLLAQAGTFTLHGGKIACSPTRMPDCPSSLPLNIKSSAPFLKKYIIPWKKKGEIRRQLEVSGIHQGTLFPELDRQSEYMKDVWLLPKAKGSDTSS